MELRIVTNTRQLQSLKHEWSELLADSPHNALPMSHSWTLAWWNSFRGEDCQLHVVTVYGSDGKMLALAPFMKVRTTFRRMTVTKMSLMANEYSPCSGIVVRCGTNASEIVECVLGYLMGLEGLDLIELTRIAVRGDVYDAAVRYLRATGRLFGSKPNIESPFISTTTDWDSFVASRSRNFRKHIRRRLNKVGPPNNLGVTKRIVRDRTAAVVEDMLAISSRSWKRELGTHIGGYPEGERFLLDLCDRFGPDGAVSIWQLSKDDVPIAFEFHITYDGVAYPLRADYRNDYVSLYPGAVLECNLLKSLFDDPAVREYYTCAATYGYLLRWTITTRRHADVQMFPKRLLPFCLFLCEYWLIPMMRWAKRLVRQIWGASDNQSDRHGVVVPPAA